MGALEHSDFIIEKVACLVEGIIKIESRYEGKPTIRPFSAPQPLPLASVIQVLEEELSM